MEGFNKILSLFVGLFVVIIIGFLLVKRFNLQHSWPLLGAKSASVTPTVTPSITTQNTVAVNTTAESLKEKFNSGSKKPTNNINTIAVGEKTAFEAVSNNGYTSTDTVAQKGGAVVSKTTERIPETGIPTLFLPLAFSGLLGGTLLRRKSYNAK